MYSDEIGGAKAVKEVIKLKTPEELPVHNPQRSSRTAYLEVVETLKPQ